MCTYILDMVINNNVTVSVFTPTFCKLVNDLIRIDPFTYSFSVD